MNCPICSSQLRLYDPDKKPEATGPMPEPSTNRWFNGFYVCPNHGQLRVSGIIFPDGWRTVHCWYPPCDNPKHKFQHMIVDGSGWRCCRCGQRYEIIGLKIVNSLMVRHKEHNSLSPAPVSWMDFLKAGAHA